MSDATLTVLEPDGTTMPTAPREPAWTAGPATLTETARLYVVHRAADGRLGSRRFVADVPAGATVFPMEAPGAAFLLVSAAIGTRAAGLSDAPVTLDPGSVDAWFAALTAAEFRGTPPFDAVVLEAGKRAFKGPASLTAPTLMWVGSETAALRFLSDTGFTDPPSARCLPVARGFALSLATPGEVDVMPTAEVIRRRGDAAFSEASQALATLAAAWNTGRVAEEEARRQAAVDRDARRFDAALRRVARTAEGRPDEATDTVTTTGDPFLSALGAVASAEGIPLRWPSAATAGDWRARLTAVCTASNIRTRQVALSGSWWRDGGPSLLGFAADTGRPVALIGSGKAYHRVDAVTGSRRRLDAKGAAGLNSQAIMLYPSLPDAVDRASLLGFVLHGARLDLVMLVLSSLAASLIGLITPAATGMLIGTAVPEGRVGLLGYLVAMVLAATLGSAAFQVGQAITLARVGSRIDLRLQAAVWDRVLRLPTGFFRAYSVGDLANRILGVDAVRRTLTSATVGGLLGGVFSLTSLGLMLAYDVRLALFAGVYASLSAAILFVLGRAQVRAQRQVSARKGKVSGLVLQLLDGIQKLRVANAERRAFAQWATAFVEQRSGAARAGWIANLQTTLTGGLPVIGALAVFVVAGGGVPPIDVATFAAFNAAFGQFTAALISLTDAVNGALAVVPGIERLRPILEAHPEVEEARIDPGTLRGRIAVRNLSFRYRDDGPWTLEDIDVTVEPGRFVAIVGPSGSGKSTLLRLLLGFETPQRGGVFYDDKDLATLDLRLARRQIGTVLQSTGLVPGSLRDNIAGAAPLGREVVMEAVRMAGLADDVAAMPMGLETMVSEGGGTLSGGQRQRVMIARALIRKPPILFFDEATSALDNRTQAVVADSLARLSATRVVIAHRLSTIRDADLILVVDGGRIVERGRFEDLIAARGTFHRLAQRQMA